jgi:hypothetical protein
LLLTVADADKTLSEREEIRFTVLFTWAINETGEMYVVLYSVG